MSNSLRPHRLQHTRFHYLPEFASDLYPLSWCYLTISSSVTSFSFCLQSFPESGTFPMSRLFTSGGQSVGASATASALPMNIQGWFPVGLTSVISLSPKDSQESSPAPQFKSINFLPLSLLYGPTLTSVYDYWENHSFDYKNLFLANRCLCFLICFLGLS